MLSFYKIDDQPFSRYVEVGQKSSVLSKNWSKIFGSQQQHHPYQRCFTQNRIFCVQILGSFLTKKLGFTSSCFYCDAMFCPRFHKPIICPNHMSSITVKGFWFSCWKVSQESFFSTWSKAWFLTQAIRKKRPDRACNYDEAKKMAPKNLQYYDLFTERLYGCFQK